MAARKDKITGLTPQQEEFAAGLAAGMSNRAAYVSAYPRAANWSKTALYPRASRLAADSNVMARVRELQRPVRERHQIDIERITVQLLEDREFARATRNAGAAVTATMGLAKLHGLLVEDRKNNRDPFEGWTPEQVREALAEVRAAVEDELAKRREAKKRPEG